MSEFQEKRIAESQARKSVRKANQNRQYGNGAVPRFASKASAIVDLFAQYVEEQMLYETNTGKGCRVQKHHIESCSIKFMNVINLFMEQERTNVALVKQALNQNKEEEE
jgi:hypothetical protein|tara:strand:+ start:532 stop:858 length:327 start_codon:yes stop_codon:yes gene_type:complete